MEREYIYVPFKENNEVKRLGARWDRDEKNWYIPSTANRGDRIELLERFGRIIEPIVELKGENREFGGSLLFVDLVPRSCWFTNVRYCIDPRDWDRVREYIYKRVNYICECCKIDTRANGVELEAHERWLYDKEKET